MVQAVRGWAACWFRSNPWDVLGNWDVNAGDGAHDWKFLRRGNGLELKIKPEGERSLALAILG